mmetsp:Transcript_40175/g.116163  ORF Transcript_40175/g.116163 Transcript_40175/m.116163 type:complete len:307 (-) Transcript_40175:720-1640(-)
MIIALIVGSQRTSLVSCIFSSSTKVAGSEPAGTRFPVTLKYTAHFGGRILSTYWSRARLSSSWAGCISSVWKAPPAFITRACRARSAIASLHSSSTAAFVPPQVKPLGNKKLATLTVASGDLSAKVAFSHSSSTLARSRPATEHIACGTSSVAFCIASARNLTSRRPSSKSSTPAATSAVYSPSDKPATACGLSKTSGFCSLSRSSAAMPPMNISGWQYRVSDNFSSGPLSAISFGSQPRMAAALENMTLTLGRSTTSFIMPTYCEPWPGKSRAAGNATFRFSSGATRETGKSSGLRCNSSGVGGG